MICDVGSFKLLEMHSGYLISFNGQNETTLVYIFEHSSLWVYCE